jgi:ESF2/ABP1 family protein
VEFKSKRDAKLIAKQLNNQQVGGRRRTPWFDEIWNIK